MSASSSIAYSSARASASRLAAAYAASFSSISRAAAALAASAASLAVSARALDAAAAASAQHAPPPAPQPDLPDDPPGRNPSSTRDRRSSVSILNPSASSAAARAACTADRTRSSDATDAASTAARATCAEKPAPGSSSHARIGFDLSASSDGSDRRTVADRFRRIASPAPAARAPPRRAHPRAAPPRAPSRSPPWTFARRRPRHARRARRVPPHSCASSSQRPPSRIQRRLERRDRISQFPVTLPEHHVLPSLDPGRDAVPRVVVREGRERFDRTPRDGPSVRPLRRRRATRSSPPRTDPPSSPTRRRQVDDERVEHKAQDVEHRERRASASLRLVRVLPFDLQPGAVVSLDGERGGDAPRLLELRVAPPPPPA